jgi:hypothetical protein
VLAEIRFEERKGLKRCLDGRQIKRLQGDGGIGCISGGSQCGGSFGRWH